MFENIFHALGTIADPFCLGMLAFGVLFGTVIGALPGLGTAVAITICIPFTLKMGSGPAIALLLGVYASSIYGGSISAVLLNTPGTPQSACTGMEGYPMAKKGQAREALGWVTMSSVLGGLISCVVLVLAAPTLAALSVKYGGPLEICALICMGLACITSLSDDNHVKGIMMGVAGLFLATIGNDPQTGEMRFTFGSQNLVSGIDLMPVVVGVFPSPNCSTAFMSPFSEKAPSVIHCTSMKLPSWSDWKVKGRISNLLRSSFLGCGLGILPGTGATAATFIAYSSAQTNLPCPRQLRQGRTRRPHRRGILQQRRIRRCTRAPTLAMGIPGEPTMALMLATLTLHGITPGVRLMADNPDIVYATFILLIMANLALIPTAWICIRGFGKIIAFPTAVLLGFIVICSLIGVYLPRSSMFDIWVTLVIGVVAFLMRLTDFPVAPLLIGYVLSNQLEYRMSQVAIYMGGGSLADYTLEHPVAIVLFAVALHPARSAFLQKGQG